MSEVRVADRSRLLRSKNAELSGIVVSRKRKLREFYAVCDNEQPIPHIALTNIDAPPTTQAEKQFLEVSDILQDRLFDESNLPTRRQLRSNTAKQRSPIRRPSPESRIVDSTRKAAKLQRDGAGSRKSRGTTPVAKPNSTEKQATSSEVSIIQDAVKEQRMRRSSSKGSQTDLNPGAAEVPDEVVEETFENVTSQKNSRLDETKVSLKALESDRIRTGIESPPGSPGADPQKVLPVSRDDDVDLSGLLRVYGAQDPHHKAATVHLPPQEVQEAHSRDMRRAREHREGHNGNLSINLPPRNDGRSAELLSSPGSTTGANSATTPALHEASTDTSPDNESGRYDVDRLDTKDDDVDTPPELRPSPEEIVENEGRDRIQRAQIQISRREILGSDLPDDDVSNIDAGSVSEVQPKKESDQSAGSADGVEMRDEAVEQLTKEAVEVVQDALEGQDRVVEAQSSRTEAMTGVEISTTTPAESGREQREVADSDADDQASLGTMDVGKTVKDSFESSSTGQESRARTSPIDIAVEASEQSIGGLKMPSSLTPSSTPRHTSSTPAATPMAVPERMTTRVASGVMRHKSVSEIMGEVARTNNSSSERSPAKGTVDSGPVANSSSPSRSTTPQSPSTRVRSLVEKAKEKERSKLSTVIFPGPGRLPLKPNSNDKALVSTSTQRSQSAQGDYYMPLFVQQAAASRQAGPSLDNLIATSHKTLTTSNSLVPILEHQTLRILKRIYHLQATQKWSLRQQKRSVEPIRPTTHWDVLLQEAKWMRTDFREERKWKVAVARNLAFACAEWVAACPEDRKILQTKAVPPNLSTPRTEVAEDTQMSGYSNQPVSHSTPDLVDSGDIDSPMDDLDEEPRQSLLETVSPAALFSLQDDDIVFALNRSPASDKLLNELPMYGSPLTVPQSELPTSEIDPDRMWKRPALPLSKYVEGQMELKTQPPPRKRSRFEYEDEEDDEEDHQVIFGSEAKTKQPALSPQQTDVGLFNPENKHIRDRIHSSHQFRPPSEFQMPLQSFFECRAPSQWTWDEDNDLKNHVREYSYNWSLISNMLSTKSSFASGAERRTPWECFERWIHLEGLPADMQKTHYFRLYTSRIDQANRNLNAQAAQLPQQPVVNGQIQPPPRRRTTTTSVRVERRRNQKHLALVDAMRKLAKKRETSIQKQQHAAGLAAMRKANEVPPTRGPTHTPQDFSRLKYEREEQMKERLAQMQQRQEQQRRAVLLAQRNGAPNPQQVGLPNNVNGAPPQPQQRLPPAPPMGQNNPSNQNNQNLAVPASNRGRPMPSQMQNTPIPNGIRVPQMGPIGGIASATMHGVQGQLPLPNPALDVNLVARAQNISEQQRQAIRMQQQQQGPLAGQPSQMHNSPPRMNGMPQPGFQVPNNMMAAPFNPNHHGVGTPPANGMISSPQGHAGSPRMGQAHNGVNHVKVLEQQLQTAHPGATPDQITRMIQERLQKSVHQQQQQRQGLAQSAMNAAAGSGIAGINPGQGGTPQMYAQMMRQQQETQQKAAQAHQQANAAINGQGQQNQNQSQSHMNGQPQTHGQVNGNSNGHQGHAHRGSSGSVQSGK